MVNELDADSFTILISSIVILVINSIFIIGMFIHFCCCVDVFGFDSDSVEVHLKKTIVPKQTKNLIDISAEA
jgi:hypothetical protein